MRIGFLSPALDFTTNTPYEQPLGGTESSVCYLAEELVGSGHEITVFNNVSTPGVYRGVSFKNCAGGISSREMFDGLDVLVLVNVVQAKRFRTSLSLTIPMVLWCTLADDQPAVQSLNDKSERDAWDGLAFVSSWHLQSFVSRFGVESEKCQVMRNAISPSFAALEHSPPWFSRNDDPVLVYTSHPARGLNILLGAFSAIRVALPRARLRIFSGVAGYQTSPDQDRWRSLYDYCRSTAGIEYVGPVGQRELANEMRGAAALAYPCIFAETSCIAALEAMAAGALILTTRLGALPETTNELAYMIPSEVEPAKLARSFADMAISVLRDPISHGASDRRRSQLDWIQKNYLWRERAREWSSWLKRLADAAG